VRLAKRQAENSQEASRVSDFVREQTGWREDIWMREGLNEPVSVLSIYSKKHKVFKPAILTWDGLDYRLGKVDFYHKTKKGATTLHHFSLSDKEESVYFKLTFNASNLNWTLQEYMMAGTNNVSY